MLGRGDVELVEEAGELPAILGQVDRGPGVPRTGNPAASSSFAIRSGVCPPNWQITPMGRSASHTARTSSVDSGSKYKRALVS